MCYDLHVVLTGSKVKVRILHPVQPPVIKRDIQPTALLPYDCYYSIPFQRQIQDFPKGGCCGYGYFILAHFPVGHIMWWADKTLADKMLVGKMPVKTAREDKILAIFWGGDP